MNSKQIIEAFDYFGEEEFKKIIVENKKLSSRVQSVEAENTQLRKELYPFYNRKFGRLVKYYYSSFHLNRGLKFLLKLFLNTCILIAKLMGYRGDRKRKDFKKFEESIIKVIKESDSEKVIFFFSPIDWDFTLVQRPQHIAKYMARDGVLYFYLERGKENEYLKNIEENLYRVGMHGDDFGMISNVAKQVEGKDFYFKFYSADWKDLNSTIENLKNAGVKMIYEYVDEISSEISGCEIPSHIIERLENSIKDEENCYVVTTATKLYEDVKYYRTDKVSLITNGVEYEHFHQKFQKKDLPFGLLKIFREGKPVIGYYGAIARWMDYEMLKAMAEARPNYNFLLIGLDYDGSLLEQNLEKYKNIHVIPPVKYKELPRYGNFFDVCMIPFKINDVTKSTSPIKLFEYMAMGKPIVTTDLPECRKYKSVLIGKTPEEFILAIDNALKKKKDKNYINLLDKEALENTWEMKAKKTLELIS